MTGKYVMFLDADDFLDDRICEVLINNMNKQSCDIVIANKVFHIDEKIVKNVLYNEKEFVRENQEKDLFLLDLFTSYFDDKMNKVAWLSCGVTAKLFKTELVKSNNIRFVEKCHFGEDVLFNMYAFEKASKIAYVDYDGYNFVISNTSSTHKYRADWDKSHEKFIDCIDKFIEENGKDDRFIEAARMMKVTRISGLAVSFYFHKDNPKKTKTAYKEFKNFIKQDKYKEAIKNVNLELLTNNQKLVLFLLRLRLTFILVLICKIKK